MGRLTPRIGDKLVNATMFSGQQSERQPAAGDNRIFDRPSEDLRERGNYPQVKVVERSAYTEAARRPVLARTIAAAATVAITAAILRMRRAS